MARISDSFTIYRPFEIDALNHTAAFMPKFKCVLNLFSISHKYHFDSLEVWAKHLLEHHCTSCNNTDSKHPVLDSPSICEADLELMLRLSIRTNLNSLLEVAVNALMRRLKDHFIFCSIAHNMELAEELGMQKFQGRLYYHELLRQEAVTKAIHASTAYSTQTSDLTEKQYSALFRGYWSLMHYWRDLPPIVRNKPLPPLTSCTGHETCETEWKKLWNEDNFKLKLDPSPHDLGPLEKLENIRSSSILPLTFCLI
jgi:hypothetical protein